MKYGLTRTYVAAATMALLGSAVRADIIAHQGFEGATSDTWEYTTTGAGGVSNISLASDFPASGRIKDGAYSYQSNNAANTLVFSSVQLSGNTAARVIIPVASISLTSGNGNDSTDYVAVYVALNGADFSTTPDLKLFGRSNAQWGFDASNTLSTTAGTAVSLLAPYGGSTNSNLQYGTLKVDLPATANSVALKIVFFNDNSGEIWATDSISLVTVPEAGSLSLLVGGGLALAGFRRK